MIPKVLLAVASGFSPEASYEHCSLAGRVMLLTAASDEYQHGQNAVFSQKSHFSQSQSPKLFTEV